jgi:hypothetical protein
MSRRTQRTQILPKSTVPATFGTSGISGQRNQGIEVNVGAGIHCSQKKLAAARLSSSMLKTAAVDAYNIGRHLTTGSSEATHMAAENLKPSVSSSDSHKKAPLNRAWEFSA